VENRLRGVTGGPSSVTLDYDAFGRLSTVTTGGVATHYSYAGAQLAAESSGGVLLRSHVSGQGVDEQWMSFEGTGAAATPNWYLQDRQNSVIGVSDASGAITPYAYGPYGEPQSWSGSRFRYTGQIAIPEAQLYHYRARAYDPVLGRFLQTDPIGYDDGPNIYAYVGGDPVNGMDPSGLEKETDVTEVEELVIPAPRREGELGGRGGGHRKVRNCAGLIDCGVEWIQRRIIEPILDWNQGDHVYDIERDTVCSAKELFSIIMSEGMSAPGADAVDGNPQVLWGFGTGDNIITQGFNPVELTIENETTKTHWFHPGTVTLSVQSLTSDSSTLRIHGTGEGGNRIFNMTGGVMTFQLIANRAMEICMNKHMPGVM
jgi:RHS repeat-associated protein